MHIFKDPYVSHGRPANDRLTIMADAMIELMQKMPEATGNEKAVIRANTRQER